MSYEPIHQGVIGYPYPGARDYYPVARPPFYVSADPVARAGMRGRSPFIPGDLIDEKVGNFYLFKVAH